MSERRFDLASFGEMLLRLSVPSGQRLESAAKLAVYPAGAEANVVSLLARLERKTIWAGALPSNPLGRLAANHLRVAGVDESGILWRAGGRLGTYYVEFGEAPRGIQVTYDRAHSVITEIKPSEINWDCLLDTRLLHLSGITPALSDSCLEITLQALSMANQKQVPVSFDINYRQRLWSEGRARETLLPMIQGVELLFCSEADARRVFDCKGEMEEIASRMLELSQARNVIVTFAERGAWLWNGEKWRHEASRPTKIIDRLGAGDALAAGVIQGWLDGDLIAGLKYGVTLAALALGQFGDMLITTKSEMLSLSDTSSSIAR